MATFRRTILGLEEAPRGGFRRGILTTLAGLLLVCGGLVLPPPAAACDGPPPPPFCGKTLVLAKAVPNAVLLTAGGSFNVSTTVFFQLLDFPAGTGICPAGPYTVDISLTATCAGGGNGAGSVTGAAMVPGFNSIAVPVTVPAGPPRQCTITGTATAALADGMTLTAFGDSVVCIVEESPDIPSEPRLDLELLGAPGAEIAYLHPGDQATHIYRITNNDLDDDFSGMMQVEISNASTLPGVAGPMPPGTGVFSPAEPFVGDNFRVGYERDTTDSCLSLTPDPGYGGVGRTKRKISVSAGGSVDIPVFSRHWGMCADGSCGEGKVQVDGDFSPSGGGGRGVGGDSGFACAGFVTAADTSVPPAYPWPDSGEVANIELVNPVFPALVIRGQPTAVSPENRIDMFTNSVGLFVNGVPVAVSPQVTSGTFNAERGRTQLQFDDTFAVDSFFDVTLDVGIAPNAGGPPIATELIDMELTGGPFGFQDITPSARGVVEIQNPSTFEVDSFFDIVYQISVVAIDDTGFRAEVVFPSIFTQAKPDGSGFLVFGSSGFLPTLPGATIDAIEINQDTRAFTSEFLQGEQLIFADGFESGDTSAWSSSVGN